MAKRKQKKSKIKQEQIPAAEESLEIEAELTPVTSMDDNGMGELPEGENSFDEEGEETDVLSQLQQQVTLLENQSLEHLDGWQRAQAEFTNYRKRIERDRVLQRQEITIRIVKRYLEVMDDLQRALQNRPEEGAGADWAEGVGLVYRKLQTILENEGVVVMEAEGELFDPNFHEAIAQEESPDHESGQIIEIIQQGYLIGGRVLRPALVRIAS